MTLKVRAGEPILNHDRTEVIARFTFDRDYVVVGRTIELILGRPTYVGAPMRLETVVFEFIGHPAFGVWRVIDPDIGREDLEGFPMLFEVVR